MKVLLDTNIILRLAQPEQELSTIARNAIKTLVDTEQELVLAPQILQEFYTVATRPASARSGLGMSPKDALGYFPNFTELAELLPELPLHQVWIQLIEKYQVSGTAAHDTRIAAFMLTHGITHILTFNNKDFSRFAPEGIVTLTPQSVLDV